MFRNRAPRAWKGVRTTVIEQKSEIRAENVRNKQDKIPNFIWLYVQSERTTRMLLENERHTYCLRRNLTRCNQTPELRAFLKTFLWMSKVLLRTCPTTLNLCRSRNMCLMFCCSQGRIKRGQFLRALRSKKASRDDIICFE